MDVAYGTIYRGGMFGSGIYISSSRHNAGNAYNDSLRIEADEKELYLKASGMASYGAQTDQRMSQEAAADYLWNQLIRSLSVQPYRL